MSKPHSTSYSKTTRDSLSNHFLGWLLQRTLHQLGDIPLTIVMPNQREISGSSAKSTRIKFHNYRALWAVVFDPVFQFAERYSSGEIEVEGDLATCLIHVFRRMNEHQKNSLAARFLAKLRIPKINSLKQSKRNIHHHYDIGNEFYRWWLDEKMVYTCAYFAAPNDSLDVAQDAKMDLVCRKLRLRPGMKVVEAGCGWGALAIYMAQHYGVQVRAFNISREQVELAREKAARLNLSEQVKFELEDWRNISGTCDAFVSVGMLEHVGRRNYKKLGQVVHRVLKDNGIGLIHSIGQNQPNPTNQWIERKIFPGAYGPTIREMMNIFETNGFQVLDIENLRLHYAKTLQHWLNRFEKVSSDVEQRFDARFVRMWRMYLASSLAAFETGYFQLFQVVFAKGPSNQVPMTREHLFVK